MPIKKKKNSVKKVKNKRPLTNNTINPKALDNNGIRKSKSELRNPSILQNNGIEKSKTEVRNSIATPLERPSNTFIIKSRVKTILSPFSKFQAKLNNAASHSVSPQSLYYTPGLNNKEISFIISHFQTKPALYVSLKNYAARAISDGKIFTIHSRGNAIRKALIERGWVEKIPPNHMKLDKIRQGKISSKSNAEYELERLLLSYMVEKKCPNFIWVKKASQIDPKEITDHTIVNKMKVDSLWTTKYGLCSTTKNNSWFYIKGVAEVSVPRTYAIGNAGDIDEFQYDYKLTACTNLLKWVLSMVANNKPVFLDCGKIPLHVIGFALNRCKEYLFNKQNKDIDTKSTHTVTTAQWNGFLQKYYKIIAKKDVFVTDRENKLPLYMACAKIVLKEIYKHRPQLSCEGCHNIWIIKPFHSCRGRGIRIASKLETITDILHQTKSKFVIQKYIEEPLLIHETKFDIRQYYLITSTYPLEIWMYQDCYLKFSSQNYSLNNYHEAIHLTNNAVQKKYKNCKMRHLDLPEQNMWHLDTYKQYLNLIGKETVWDNVIYPGMQKSIVSILLACQEQLRVTKNRFELHGCDFILDKEFKPWLIEINSGPDLSSSTSVTAKICPAVLKDIVKVVIDRAINKKAPTGKFQRIYHQPITLPRYNNFTDLYIRGLALPSEYFYRGKMQLQGSYLSQSIGRSTLSATMTKLKELHGKGIIVKPDKYGLNVQGNCYTDAGKVRSELELQPVIITEESNNLSRKSSNDSGEDFIESCLKTVRSFATSPEGIYPHNFSMLEDECSIIVQTVQSTRNSNESDTNSDSEFDCNELKHTRVWQSKYYNEQTEASSLPKFRQEMKKHTQPQSNAFIIQEASVKLLDFLNKKEYEYKNSCKRLF